MSTAWRIQFAEGNRPRVVESLGVRDDRTTLHRASVGCVREREPTSTTDALEIAFDGETHRGQRVVLRVSDEEIRQEVRYELLRQIDPDVYRAHESDFMRAIAREILWRLVKQWKTQGIRTPVKVEARARGTRRASGSGPRSEQAG